MMQALTRLIAAISSLRLTLFCLAAALVLVLAGTLAQVRFGLFFVQEHYFQSWLVWWSPASGAYRIPMFPGGHLVGAVLLVNLIAAHVRRFSWTWRKLGIQLTHLGLIIMLGGGLATDLFSVNSVMRIREGETKNYSEDTSSRMELALIDSSDPATDQVTAIPGELLAKGGTISDDSLPFKITLRSFFSNSVLSDIDPGAASAVAAATNGIGVRVAVSSAPPVSEMDKRDVMSAVIEISPAKGGKSLGTWLVSDRIAVPQNVELEGRKWMIALRPVRYYKSYSLTLKDFSRDLYPGTEIPKNFSSKVELTDEKDSRQVLIYMNHPLRHEGDTFYQSSFDSDDGGTVLQVVRNPSYQAPYIACIIVSIGLIYQFSFHLAGFARRTKPTPAS